MQLQNLIWQIAFTCESYCELKETILNTFVKTHFIHQINCFQSMVDLLPMGIVLLIPFMANIRCLDSSPRAPSKIGGGTGFPIRHRIGNASKKEAIEDKQSRSLETLNASHAPSRPSDDGGVPRKRGGRRGGGEGANSKKSEARCLGGQPDQVKH